MCLQETKKPVIGLAFIKSCCPKRFDKFTYIPSRGASGGLLTVWNSSIFSGTMVVQEDFALGIQFTSTISAQAWTLYNIYGPCTGPTRDEFTQWIYDRDIQTNEYCLFLGDFNYIRYPSNRNDGAGNINNMMDFNAAISQLALVEIPLKGRSFTWSNMQQAPLLEKIDWVFTSENWSTQ